VKEITKAQSTAIFYCRERGLGKRTPDVRQGPHGTHQKFFIWWWSSLSQ